MMKLFRSFTLIALMSAALLTSCEKEKGNGGEEQMSICQQYKNLEIESEYVEGGKVKYNVLTPPNFDPFGEEKYCVIYLLHGAGDDNTAWLDSPQNRGSQKSLASQMYSAVKEGIIPKTVVVMPDAGMSFYMGDFEEFFYKELVPQVEKKFNVDSRKECRAVAGLSMGGYGSAYYGVKYPDYYCYVYTMSMASNNELFQWYAEQNKAKLPPFFVVNGEQDSTVGKSPESFVEMMAGIGITCGYESWLGGHDWKFWGECIPKFLEKIGAEFKKTK